MLSEISYKIINIILEICQGDVISISGDIHNGNSEENALIEIPFIEELALSIRKRKAFAVLEISTENLKRRFLSEMPEEIYDLPIDYYSNWVENLDAFIDIGWRTNPELYNNISDRLFKKIENSTLKIWETIQLKKKKLLFIGFPSQSLSNYFNIDYELLKKSFFQGMNCDYHKLKNTAIQIKDEFGKIELMEIKMKDVKLFLELQENSGKIFIGSFADESFVILPTGRIEFSIKKENFNGDFFAEKVYYENFVLEDITVNLFSGNVKAVSFSNENNKNNTLKNAIMSGKMNFKLSIGINENLTDYCNYSLFDQNIKNNFSLKTYDKSEKEIIFSNLKTKIQNITKEIEQN